EGLGEGTPSIQLLAARWKSGDRQPEAGEPPLDAKPAPVQLALDPAGPAVRSQRHPDDPTPQLLLLAFGDPAEVVGAGALVGEGGEEAGVAVLGRWSGSRFARERLVAQPQDPLASGRRCRRDEPTWSPAVLQL